MLLQSQTNSPPSGGSWAWWRWFASMPTQTWWKWHGTPAGIQLQAEKHKQVLSSNISHRQCAFMHWLRVYTFSECSKWCCDSVDLHLFSLASEQYSKYCNIIIDCTYAHCTKKLDNKIVFNGCAIGQISIFMFTLFILFSILHDKASTVPDDACS